MLLTQQAFLCGSLLHTGLFELGTDFFEGNSICIALRSSSCICITINIMLHLLQRRRRRHTRFRTGIAWPFHNIVDIVMHCAVLRCVLLLSFYVSSFVLCRFKLKTNFQKTAKTKSKMDHRKPASHFLCRRQKAVSLYYVPYHMILCIIHIYSMYCSVEAYFFRRRARLLPNRAVGIAFLRVSSIA